MAQHDPTRATSDTDSDGDGGGRSTHAQISRAIIHLLAEYTGRGPTRARTTINGNLVVCVVEDTLTKGERKLVANGQEEAVLRMRGSYQRAMGPEATAVVERLTGRNVVAFMSTNHADPDYGVEVFILEGPATSTSQASDPVGSA